MRYKALVHLVLVVGVMLPANVLFGQDGVLVRFDKDFRIPSETKISFGKKILLSGPKDTATTRIAVSWTVGIQEGRRDAALSDTTWSLLVGPFPARERAIFQFQSTTNFAPSVLIGLVRKTLDVVLDSLLTVKVVKSTEEYKKLVVAVLSQVVPKDLLKYKSTSGGTLYDLLFQAIKKIEPARVLSLFQNMQSSKQLQNDFDEQRRDIQSRYLDRVEFSTIVKQLDQMGRPAMADMLKGLKQNSATAILETWNLDSLRIVIKQIPSLQADTDWSVTFLNKIDGMKKLQADIETAEKLVAKLTDAVVNEASWPLVQVREFSWASETSAEVSDVEYYAGFDVGGLAVSDFGVFPAFTVNVYLTKIDSDKDPRNFLEFVSLSAGVALKTADLPTEGTAYFAGVGCRMNKLFRITVGSTLYNASDSKKLVGKLSIGLSIHFRYVTDVLKIFSGASSSIIPQ